MARALSANKQRMLKCAAYNLDLSSPKIMGVLNVTPDSFSDGGLFFGPDNAKALAHVERMVLEGASIIDVGGESTRPGAKAVSVQEELDRVTGIVDAVIRRFDVIVSVDTSRPEVMLAAASAGAGMINDVRALSEPGALAAVASLPLPVCLMHMQGKPETMQAAPRYDNPLVEIIAYLQARIGVCEQAGISRERIIVDPGFGFGKTLEHNLKLLRQLDALAVLNLPLLVGMSRKNMIGQILEKPVGERLFGSIAAATIAVLNGANIIRCHDVAATVDAVKVAAAVLNEQCGVA
jgi:dihydropteroate synthase